MMNYKFKEVILNLERDTIEVVVSFQETRNRWQLKSYKYDATDEIDIDDLLDKTKRQIEG